ncbi:MAG: N-acetyltransferase [Bryobacterales bacterium]|nr:N-acetyltransferase [Bryobacterales bacterium]
MIRHETDADHEAIRRILQAAFKGAEEVRLVDALRAADLFITSLIDDEADTIRGHALFTRLDSEHLRVASLAPVAVDPAHQRRGIGGALILAGIEECRNAGYDAIAVLGHPAYYPRFGFTAELGRRVASPYSSHGESWMAMELRPGALRDPIEVRYPPAWDVIA